LAAWKRLPKGVERPALAALAVFVLAGYAGWIGLEFTSSLADQARLFFAMLPPLALLAASGFSAVRGLDTPALRVSVVVTGALILALGLGAVEVINHFASQQPLAYLTGGQTAKDFEVSQLGGYPLAMDQVNALPPGARIEFLWEARSLGCAAAVRCVPDVVIDRWWHARATTGTAAATVQQWQAAGVTHVLLYETGRAFEAANPRSPLQPGDWAELEALRRQLRVVATVGDAYTLYALP
jgi:hypothetical protein